MTDNSAIVVNQLRATLGKMEMALGAIVEAIVWTDEHGRVHWSNATFDRLVARQRFQVLAASLFDLLPLKQDGLAIPRELHPLSIALQGQNSSGVYELEQVDKRLILEISSSLIEFQRQPACAVIVIRDITKTQQESQRQAMQFAVTRILAESTTIEEAMPKLLAAICYGTGWQLGAMWQLNSSANLLRCHVIWHSPRLEASDFEHISREINFTPGIGLPGRVWVSGQPAWIKDVVTDNNFPRAAAATKDKLHGAFALPILNGNRVAGVMEFFNCYPRQPDEEILLLMVDIGSQINQFVSRKQAEVALSREQNFLNAVLNTVEAGIIACNTEGAITLFNHAALEFHGVAAAPLTATQWAEDYNFYFADSKRKMQLSDNPLLRALQGEEISNLEMQVGEARTFLVSCQSIFEAGGKNIGAVVAMHDITERKIAEQERAQLIHEQVARSEAQAAQQRIQNILESITDGFVALDKQWCFNYINKEAERFYLLMQRSRHELIGKNIWEEFPETVGSTLYQEYQRAVERQVTVNFEEFYPLLNRWYEFRSYPSSEGLSVYFRDITDQKQAEVEIYRALEKERELVELKSQFVTQVSHEFRTPLAIILNSSDLLQFYGQTFSDDKKLQHFTRIQTSVKRMTQFLDDVLFIGKAQAGRLEFNPVKISLKALCLDILEGVELADGKKHNFNFDGEFTNSIVEVDENLVRQILTNLLANAVKYSQPGSSIYFKVICNPSQAIFQIRDEGIGIPAAEQQHLFERFHRATNVGNIPGTGLGMVIIKNALELHRGSIAVESEVGVGTTVNVCIPISNHNVSRLKYN